MTMHAAPRSSARTSSCDARSAERLGRVRADSGPARAGAAQPRRSTRATRCRAAARSPSRPRTSRSPSDDAAGGRPPALRELSVRDTGVGHETRRRSRASSSRSSRPRRSGKGTGLGLSTVLRHRRAERRQHQRRQRAGQRHRLPRLPAARRRAAEPRAAAAGADERRRRAARETILLVEDDEDVRDFVQDVLRRTATRCSTAVDGARGARDRASSTPAPIHLLLTDVVMPRMSGSELAKRSLRCARRSRCSTCPATRATPSCARACPSTRSCRSRSASRRWRGGCARCSTASRPSTNDPVAPAPHPYGPAAPRDAPPGPLPRTRAVAAARGQHARAIRRRARRCASRARSLSTPPDVRWGQYPPCITRDALAPFAVAQLSAGTSLAQGPLTANRHGHGPHLSLHPGGLRQPLRLRALPEAHAGGASTYGATTTSRRSPSSCRCSTRAVDLRHDRQPRLELDYPREKLERHRRRRLLDRRQLRVGVPRGRASSPTCACCGTRTTWASARASTTPCAKQRRRDHRLGRLRRHRRSERAARAGRALHRAARSPRSAAASTSRTPTTTGSRACRPSSTTSARST